MCWSEETIKKKKKLIQISLVHLFFSCRSAFCLSECSSVLGAAHQATHPFVFVHWGISLVLKERSVLFSQHINNQLLNLQPKYACNVHGQCPRHWPWKFLINKDKFTYKILVAFAICLDVVILSTSLTPIPYSPSSASLFLVSLLWMLNLAQYVSRTIWL